MASYASEQRTITFGSHTFDWSSLRVSSTNNFSTVDGGKTLVSTTSTFDIAGFIIGTSQADFAAKVIDFREALSTPRQSFSVVYNAATWYSIDFDVNDTNGTDIAYGPNCTDFGIEEYIGGLAAAYTATIETTEKICNAGNVKKPLQITKETSYTINEGGFVTRVISGIVVTTQQGLAPDAFKELVDVKVPKFFKRTSQNYTVQEDGITMKYSITDIEQFHTLPKTIVTGAADFVISTEFGAKVTLTLSGSFGVDGASGATGDKGKGKIQAFNEIVKLLQKYILPHAGRGFAFTRQEIKTGIYTNTIDFMFTGFMAGVADVKTNPYRLLYREAPPGSDGKARAIPQGGSAGLFATTRPIEDSCITKLAKTEEKQKGDIDKQSESTPAVKQSKTLQALTLNAGISTQHIEAVYVDYHEKISYEINSNIVVMVPKSKSEKQIAQQTTQPTINIVQVGYASRRGDTPQVPDPIVKKPSGYLLQYSVSPDQPILNDKQKIYTTSWRYIIRVVDNSKTPIKNIKVPDDPRLAKPKDPKDLKMPSSLTLESLI